MRSPATSATELRPTMRSRKPCGCRRADILVNNAGQICAYRPARRRRAARMGGASSTSISSAPRSPRGRSSGRCVREGRGTIVTSRRAAAPRAMEGLRALLRHEGGVACLTKSLALEHGPLGIRVFGFAPGIVDTEMQASIRASGIGLTAKLPRNMLGEPERAGRGNRLSLPERRSSAGRPGARHPQCRIPGGRRPEAAADLTAKRACPMRRDEIIDVRAYRRRGEGDGGDYHDREKGHWLIDSLIANPMSGYADYKASRTSWGIAVLGSLVVEIETRSGKRRRRHRARRAAGLLHDRAAFPPLPGRRRSAQHQSHLGPDVPRQPALWPEGHHRRRASRSSTSRSGISSASSATSRSTRMIGGATRDALDLYCTGPRPETYKAQGFWGGKVPLPHGPADGPEGLRRERRLPRRASRGGRARFPADGRLLHGARRRLCRGARRGAAAGRHLLDRGGRCRPTMSTATASSRSAARRRAGPPASTNTRATASAR